MNIRNRKFNNNDSRTVNSGKNIITNLFNKTLILLLTFISRKIFIDYIGVEYLGISSLFSNILSLLSLVDLGFGIAMNYSFYEPLAISDTKKVSALITFYKKVYNIIAIAVFVIGVAITPFLRYIINMDVEIANIQIYYLVNLCNIVVSYLFVYKSAILNADQKGYLVNKYNIIVMVLKVVLQVIIMVICKNYLMYILLEVAGTLINNLIVSAVADKLYPYINKKEELNIYEKDNITKNMKSVFIYKISSSIMASTDSIIISIVVGTTAVGYYTNYLTVTNSLSTFITIIFSSLTASVGNLIIKGNEKSKYEVFKTMQMISSWISGIVVVSILVLIQDFIVLWLGNKYLLNNFIVVAITLNFFFTMSMQPIWSYREASGLYQKTKYIMLLTAIINLILSIFLGKLIGIAGVVIATVIARLVTYFWYEPKLLYKLYFNQKVRYYYFDYFVNFILIMLCLITSVCFTYLIVDISIFSWVLKSIVCLVITNLTFFIRYYKTNEFKYLTTRIKSLFVHVMHSNERPSH